MGRKPFINKKVLVSLFIVGIMVLSTFGFILSYSTSQSQKQKYRGYKFVATEQGIKTEVNEKEIILNYFPTQLEDINITESVSDLLKNMKMVTVTYNPTDAWATAMAEVQYRAEQEIPEYTDIYVARGLTNSTGYTVSEITCENATATNPVLELKESNTTQVKLEDNCIIASIAHENDIYRVYERILYIILGIME